MRIEQIIKLVTEAAEGKDDFKEGAVGSNGYGFVFRDFDSHPTEPYIVPWGYSKFCGAGSHRLLLKRPIESFSDFYRYDVDLDLLVGGSLKTLVPTLKFGGDESLFRIWMFVRTPEDRMFPATIYWGQSGLSIGGWSKVGVHLLIKEQGPLDEFSEIINSRSFSSPSQLTEDETGCFLDALEFALKKVPPSDFWGIYNHDLGNRFLGLRKGALCNQEIGHFERDLEAEKELEPLLGKGFKDVYEETFIINLLPGRRIYAVEFEKDVFHDDIIFGNAAKVLKYWKSQCSESYRTESRRKMIEEQDKMIEKVLREISNKNRSK